MPNLARAHLNRGNALLALGDPEAALGAYAAALDHDPDYAAAHYNLGNACFAQVATMPRWRPIVSALALKSELCRCRRGDRRLARGPGPAEEAAACYRRALDDRPGL